jgi:hypothetical protein
MKQLLIFMLLLYTSLSPMRANAQLNETENSEGFYVSIVLTTTTYLGMTAAIAGSIYMTSMILTDDDEAQAYLQEHQLDVVQGLATGEGPFVELVSSAFHVRDAERPAFTQKLTSHYDELAELADAHTLTPQRAHRFFEMISQLRTQL